MNKRDRRLVLDLAVPYDADIPTFDKIETILAPIFKKAVVINEGQPNEERGYISIVLCGHRFGESCNEVARWEVGKGKVI